MFGMSRHASAKPAREAKPKAESSRRKLVEVTLKMEPAQRSKLDQLGGADWVREQIDAAGKPAGPFEA
jgi:hypothetical protein